ncbi:MAG TPA: glycosyltransferase [Gryllotalpicola sp.]
MILLCVNEVVGRSGYHRLIVDLANGLHRNGYPVTVLGFARDARRSVPTRQERRRMEWKLDDEIPLLALQTLVASGGAMLHRNYHPVLSGRLESGRYNFTANELEVLRDLNRTLTPDDTILFTSPITAMAFAVALHDEARRPRTILQAHGNYEYYTDLIPTLEAAREGIGQIQTSTQAARKQFVPLFDEADVISVPNFPSETVESIEPVAHEGVNIVQPASFQTLKNQLDAVRALALINDESVHLTLWGVASTKNPYVLEVQALVASLGLEHRVHIPGFGTEQDIYSQADIVTLCSLAEGFPNTLTESALHGLPVVAFDFDFGPREIIEDGASGYIVPLRDVDALAERWSALAADPELRERFGRRAREIYDAGFSYQQVSRKYREFLGAPHGKAIDLAQMFARSGTDPVTVRQISRRLRTARGRVEIQVAIGSSITLHDVRIDNGTRVFEPRVKRRIGQTLITFAPEGDEIISYSMQPGSADRYYLASIKAESTDVEVLPWLRRDFRGYRQVAPIAVGTTESDFVRARRAVIWKLRQLTRRYFGKKRDTSVS